MIFFGFRRLLTWMSGLCLLAALCFAQSDRGTITGTVLDPGGAVIPGAAVTATNTQTGSATRGETTATGAFTLLSLPAGEYELAVEADGFRRSVRQGVRVGVAQTARLDVVLEIGATTETITITADAPLLQTESAEQSTNISGEMFNSLPLNFGGGGGSSGNIRGWLGFIQLAPGVSGNDHRAAVNGAPGGSFKIYLEGQDVTSTNDTVWTSTVAAASVETIGDFTMQTSNYSAEFGQVMGGVFNFTTKSGTNELHGSAYDYFTNEALDAHRPFSQARPVNRKHDYGFTVGGPVYIPKVYDGRNRTFFFIGWERFRNNTTSAGTLNTVPTAAYRQGDFSQALTGRQLGTDELGRPIMENQLYDPASTYLTAGGVQMRDPFPNNIIPQGRLDPVSLKVQALIPSPDNGDLVSNWDPRIPGGRVQSIPSLKIDHAFTDNAKISGYYSVQNTEQITANDGLPIPITGRRDQLIFGKTFRVNYDHTLSPTVLMHLGAGYLRFHNPDSSPLAVLEYDAVSGIGFTGAASDPSGFPRITGITGNAANRGGSPSLGPNQANRFWNDKLTSVASLTWVKNNHNYKFGGEFKQEVWTDVNLTRSQGGLDFDVAQTALPSPLGRNTSGGSTGFEYASFLLGLADSAQVSARRDPQWRKKAWSFYAQDNWKITRKLTFDYGLRYDLAGAGHEIYYRTSVVDTKLPNPSAGNLPGAFAYEGYGPGRCDCRFSKTYPYAFGPRLGLAYQLDDKTVLRAGWGLSYSAGANWWYVTGGSNQLGLGFNSIDWSTAEYGATAVRFRDGLQYDRGDLYTATLDPGIRPSPGQLNVPAAWGGQINDRNGGRPGRVNQWNISLQREIIRDLSVEVSYVANRAVWLEANDLVGVNAIRSGDLAAAGLDINSADDRQLLRSRIDSPLAESRGFSAPYGGYPGGATVAQTLRPFPQFDDNLATRWAPLGKTWYDSLQIKLNKRYSHGFDMTAAFTYQRERGLGTGGRPSALGPAINNLENFEAQKGLMPTSQPYIFVVGFNYDSPGLGTNKYLRAITKDWTVGGVLRYASGSLIAAPNSQNNLSQLLFQNTRMNRVESEPLFLKDPNCGCIDPFKDFVYNPAAWANPTDGQFGDAQGYYDDYRWQHQVSESMNLGRRFRIWESVSFEVRAEFFNVFNRLFLPIPGGNNPLTNPAYSSSDGRPTNGFGFIDPFGNPQANTTQNTYPRSGQIVARIQF